MADSLALSWGIFLDSAGNRVLPFKNNINNLITNHNRGDGRNEESSSSRSVCSDHLVDSRLRQYYYPTRSQARTESGRGNQAGSSAGDHSGTHHHALDVL